MSTALERYTDTVRKHGFVHEGSCGMPHCSLCHAWAVWRAHPEWGGLPPRWWAWDTATEHHDRA